MSNSDVIITVDRLSKRYQLGQIGATSLRESAERFWHKIRRRNPDEHMGLVGAPRQPKVPKLQSSKVTEAGRESVTELQSGKVTKLAKPSTNPPQPSPSSPCNPVTLEPCHPSISLCNPVTLEPCHPPSTSPDELWALKDVSFEVKRGEVLGIIGRNGAGKSTLLKILTRITEPTSGRAIMRGRVASLLEVGTGFHPELTGRENIFLNGAILGMKRAEIAAKFDEIVAFSEVEQFIDTPVKRYSSGMYVRLAFAVAAHLEPEILLVDEVLAVGDAIFQDKCVGKMSQVARTGRTVLFVSHNMGMISSLCSSCLCFSHGAISASGTTASVVHKYFDTSAYGVPRVDLDRGSSTASIRSIWIGDASGQQIKYAPMHESFTIVMEIDARQIIRDTEISVQFLNSDGYIVCTTSYSEVAGSYCTLQTGLTRLAVRVPEQFLAPDRYCLSVAIHRPNAHVYDNRLQVLSFTVAPTSDELAIYSGVKNGSVLTKFPWRAL